MLPVVLHGQDLFLSDPISVSTSGTGLRAPRIALLEGNRPVVYWGKTGGSPTLYLAIWQENAFSEPIPISTNGIEPDLWGGGLGPQIAAQDDLIFLVFENYGNGIYCVRSEDGGLTFSDPVSVFEAPVGRVATIPSLAITPSGNPVISFVTTNFSEQNAQYEVAHSLDGGVSFEPTVLANSAAPGEEVCECCPASIITATDDEWYLAFRNNDENLRDIWIAKSTDGGSSFAQATDIDNTDWVIQSCPQSGPDMLLSGDSIFTALYSGANGSNIYLSTLDKNTMQVGNQFQIPSVSGDSQNQNFPAIAGRGDTLAVIWQENGPGTSWDINLAWTTTGTGVLQNQSMPVDNDLLSQKQPDIAFADGQFHIVYEDYKTSRVLYRTAGFEPIVQNESAPLTVTSVSVTPNPVQEQLAIVVQGTEGKHFTAILFDANGQLVGHFNGLSDQMNIDTDRLKSGIYFINIQLEDRVVNARFVKQ